MGLASHLPGTSPCVSLPLWFVGPPTTILPLNVTYLIGCRVVPSLMVTGLWCLMWVQLPGSRQSFSQSCSVSQHLPLNNPCFLPGQSAPPPWGTCSPDLEAGTPLQFPLGSLVQCAGEAQLTQTPLDEFFPVPILRHTREAQLTRIPPDAFPPGPLV